MTTHQFEISALAQRVLTALEAFQASTGLRIEIIWLSPLDLEQLVGEYQVFDKAGDPQMVEYWRSLVGETLVGYLFNCLVFSSEIVPQGHIAMLPDGMLGKLMTPEATRPF